MPLPLSLLIFTRSVLTGWMMVALAPWEPIFDVIEAEIDRQEASGE